MAWDLLRPPYRTFQEKISKEGSIVLARSTAFCIVLPLIKNCLCVYHMASKKRPLEAQNTHSPQQPPNPSDSSSSCMGKVHSKAKKFRSNNKEKMQAEKMDAIATGEGA